MGWQGRTAAGITAGLTLGLLAGALIWGTGESGNEAGSRENLLWSQANAQMANLSAGQGTARGCTLADLKPFPEEGAIASKQEAASSAKAVTPLPVRQMGTIPGGLRLPVPKRPERKAEEAVLPLEKQTVEGKAREENEKESYSSKIAFTGGGSIGFGKQGE